jgi:multidrug efflux pump
MKNLTALFIRRPVLSLVVSAIILVLGLRAMGSLPVLEYPKTENATITITTTYPGPIRIPWPALLPRPSKTRWRR